MITAQVSPACYANVTYMTKTAPGLVDRNFVCGLNQLVMPVVKTSVC